METIKGLVRSLALLVLVAAFIEMLLPNQKMKRYVQLILGLFVIVTVLTPITRIIGQGESLSVFDWQAQGQPDNLKTILDQGQALTKQGEERLANGSQTQLAKQMEAMVRLIPGVEEATVKVVTENGAVKEIQVQAREGKTSVQDVQIGDKPALVRSLEGLQTRQEIVNTLANFYGLQPEQIHVSGTGGAE